MDYSTTLLVLIGAGEKKFHVPECLLVEKSDFFKAACTKPWREARVRLFRQPEMEAEAFSDYLHWIYQGVVATRERGDGDDEDFSDVLRMCYTKLWITEDQLGDHEFRNLAIETMVGLTVTSRYFPGYQERGFHIELPCMTWPLNQLAV